ncbi:Uncharacterised protein [Burkholderia pseudomallei]|nr:hypothetical protein DO63_6160 [Burkholderia pseudomallei]KOS78616.1 benzoylformate decarboxylase domain protein [Burkholderia mallei]KGD32598.1 thiamine pyrophosphate central region domain protein [Burkholderia pseudomallei]KGD59407.1 benzoylformate decarboxylase domain protein [Burkholderia pseudomallei]KOT06485.1 benzoylformate decarboxylase domain protein [Burkholderia mallei]
MRSRIGGRKPAKSGWSSGKLQRPDIGAAYTRARCRSASRTASSHAPARATAAPTTNAGRSLASSASPSRASASGAGRTSLLTVRAGMGSAGRSQSSAGIDTNTGPRGSCIAT